MSFSALDFEGSTAEASLSVAVIADLEGFTKFHNIPTLQHYIKDYLTWTFRAINVLINGGEIFWAMGMSEKKLPPLSSIPVHVKYLGDGALYIFHPPAGEAAFPQNLVDALLRRLYLMSKFFKIFNKWYADNHCNTNHLPQGIRFGVAHGTVFRVVDMATQKEEYHGIPINFASRLQSYSRGLGVVASALIGKAPDGFVTVVAESVRDFPSDRVYVPSVEWGKLSQDKKNGSFCELDDDIREEAQSFIAFMPSMQ